MSESCVMCGATENLQLHHWLYGDEEMEKGWTTTLCVKCHQKIHRGHGVGCGAGYTLKKNPETILKFFKAVLNNPKIPTFKLAEEVGISEATIRKLRRKWGLDKQLIGEMEKGELEKVVIWKLYTILEYRGREKRGLRRQKRRLRKRDVYVKKELYDRIVLLRADVSEFVNDAVREKLEKEEK